MRFDLSNQPLSRKGISDGSAWVGLTSSRHTRGNLGKRIEDVEKAYKTVGGTATNQGENDEFHL